MAQAGLSSFSPAPVLHALGAPLLRLLHRATQPCRHNGDARIYLGQGQPVMVFPAFGGGAQSTVTLRATLNDAGFTTHDWGLGVDTGPGEFGLDRCLRRLEEQVIEVFESARAPVTLLGWGLSGIYAREVAKRTDPLVRQVITLGTPFNTAAEGAHQCQMLRALASREGRFDPAVWTRLRQRPPVPSTSIYGTADGVVPWRLCVESESPTSENIGIAAGHHELGRHPKAIEVITQRLAQPDEEWRPFAA
jgi:hypothetical protein